MRNQTAFEQDRFLSRLEYDRASNNVSFSSSAIVDSSEWRTGTSLYPLDERSAILISLDRKKYENMNRYRLSYK